MKKIVAVSVHIFFFSGSRQQQPYSFIGSVAAPSEVIDEEGEPRRIQVTRFTDDSGVYSRENTKAVLINTGEKMASALHDILTESAELEGGK